MTLEIAVLDDHERVARDMAEWSALEPGARVTFFHDILDDEAQLVSRLAGFDIICLMRERTAFPRSVIGALPRLRLLVTSGPRNTSIDMAAAHERGIVVSGTRAFAHPTAELVFAHLLEFARQVGRTSIAMKTGEVWPAPVGIDLQDKVLGIVGLGRLGRRVAQIGEAFGMEVLAWSQNLTAEACSGTPARPVGKAELFERADFVTLHLKLSARTQGIVGAAELARMKPEALLINTSRGPLIDEAALIDALQHGRIAGAALDVFDHEPLAPDHPFRTLDRAVISPHRGYVTREHLRLFYGQMVEDIAAYIGGVPIRVVEA
ncbi:MAG: D-2-hydroxyacid dehydrogenase family protein [Rhodobacteraceae bacterium]|nr:D-2-hydroxyacid dehydrogenase family protein [Paracoccaceae bacterium]